jgi:hypothetical protein
MIGARHARRLVLSSKKYKERKELTNKKRGGRVYSFS